MSQRELADRLGVHQVTVSSVEREKCTSETMLKYFSRMAKILEIPQTEIDRVYPTERVPVPTTTPPTVDYDRIVTQPKDERDEWVALLTDQVSELEKENARLKEIVELYGKLQISAPATVTPLGSFATTIARLHTLLSQDH